MNEFLGMFGGWRGNSGESYWSGGGDGMARRVGRDTSRLLSVASEGESGVELVTLGMACAELEDGGVLAEAFAKGHGLAAIGVAVRAALEGGKVRKELFVCDCVFEDEVHALLAVAAKVLRRCRKDVLKLAAESTLVDTMNLACSSKSCPSIGTVTAAADIVGTLAAACDYNALRSVELGLLDSVLRAAKDIRGRGSDGEGPKTRSKRGSRASNPAQVTPEQIAALDHAVLRALTGSGLDVPKHPRGGRRGVRILCLDGGGTRALTSLELVREIERQSGQPVHKLFDLIGGTSTGGVLALALGLCLRSVTDCEKVYKAMASRIFARRTRVLSAGRLLLLNKGQYNTTALEAVLRDALGDSVLVDTRLDDSPCPRVFVVSTLMNSPSAVPYLHANYRPPPRPPGSGEHRYKHGCHHKLWEAARASTAVPSYFDAYRSGGEVFCDGAILVNNPAAIAVHEARLLWPNAPLECIVSLGTGRSDPHTTVGSENLYDVAKALINSATDTEAVHHALEDLAPEGVYYRFNPVISSEISESFAPYSHSLRSLCPSPPSFLCISRLSFFF